MIQRHNIEKGKLALSEPAADVAQDYNPPRNAKLYVHDVANNRSREVSEEEAQRLSLDTRRLSPDGYAVVQNHSSGLIGLLIPVQDRNSRYLAGAWLSKKLNLEMPSANIQVRVLGWIEH